VLARQRGVVATLTVAAVLMVTDTTDGPENDGTAGDTGEVVSGLQERVAAAGRGHRKEFGHL
jgi:hypothetical protein